MFRRATARLIGTILYWVAISALAQTATMPRVSSDRVAAPAASIAVRFEGGHLVENLSAVLGRLVGSGLVKFEPIDATGARDLDEALTRANGWPRGAINRELESTICSANQHSCTKRATGRIVWSFTKESSSSLCGSLAAGSLCVPKLQVKPYRTLQTRSYGPGENLSKIVRNSGACRSLDPKCREDLEYLNRGDLNSGRIRLLVDAYQIPLFTTDTGSEREVERIVREVAAAQASLKRLSSKNTNIFLTKAVEFKSEQVNAGGNIDVRDAYSAVSLPDQAQISNLRSVDIGFFDGRVDADHCVLKRKTSANAESIVVLLDYDKDAKDLPVEPNRDTACKRILKHWRELTVYDHATHVIALVAGQRHENGFYGLMPNARVWLYEAATRKKPPPDPIAAALDSNERIRLVAVNVSQTFDGDDSKAYVRRLTLGLAGSEGDGWAERIVFVMAAGQPKGKNEPALLKTTNDCTVFPACWAFATEATRAALLSVVALDRSGGVLRDSKSRQALTRYGPLFDVAAPGYAVSAYFGNSFGPMEGSSVATPFVTALVGLLSSKVDRDVRRVTEQKQIADRVRFTADVDPALRDVVRFGRVNYGRALSFQHDRLKWVSKGKAQEGSGLVSRSGVRLSIIDGFRYDAKKGEYIPLESGFGIDWTDVRRIVKTPGKSEFWIFASDKNGNIERYTNVSFGPNQNIIFRKGGSSPDNDKEDIALADLLDYTSCSFLDRCVRSR